VGSSDVSLRDRACCFAKLVGRGDGSHHCDKRDLALSSGPVSRRRRGGGGGARKGRGRVALGQVEAAVEKGIEAN
jgi:hypothetical protein